MDMKTQKKLTNQPRDATDQRILIMEKSTVEFLRKQIILNSKYKENSKGGISLNIGLSKFDELFYEAKEMEKDQIYTDLNMIAYAAFVIKCKYEDMLSPKEWFKQYYNEQYETD